jgi:poly(3-hydroxybutyrate) depolymerase
MARLLLLVIALVLGTVMGRSNMHVNEDRVSKAMSAYRQHQATVKATAIPAGQNEFTIERPEGVRTYYVWVPQAYDSSNPPSTVLFAFHGLGDLCTDFGPETGFQELSEELNFLYVYPCGTQGLLGVAWNAGT